MREPAKLRLQGLPSWPPRERKPTRPLSLSRPAVCGLGAGCAQWWRVVHIRYSQRRPTRVSVYAAIPYSAACAAACETATACGIAVGGIQCIQHENKISKLGSLQRTVITCHSRFDRYI